MNASIAVVFLAVPALFAAAPQSAVVIVPVADVWSRPLAVGEKPTDDLRETQVLFGEKVLIHESSGPWVRIEAVEQPTFRQHQQWEGYPGWVLQTTVGQARRHPNWLLSKKRWEYDLDSGKELPIGARTFIAMAALGYSRPPGSGGILETADLLVGIPYLWGGLTPGNPPSSAAVTPAEAGVQKNGLGSGFRRNDDIKYGIDCSGLVHLSYRVNGLTIPRDAHEQWMTARPIKRAELKPADLIFSAKADNPKKITHVALYAGDGMIIEAPQAGMVVRTISFKEKYGMALQEVESGDRVGNRVIYFGSFLR